MFEKLIASIRALFNTRRSAAPALPPQDTGATLREALGMPSGIEYQPTSEFDSIGGMGSPWFRK